jgi:NitT/TauT family transport system substrate-binding protein
VRALSRARALALLASTPLVARARPAFAQAVPVRIGAVGTLSFAEPYFLAETPFAKNAGLDVQVTTFNNGGAIGAAIAGGSLDVGLSDTIQIANASNRGLSFAGFAGSSIYRSDAPLTVLCTGKTGPVHTAKDLEGKAIGVNGLHTLAEISVREWMQQNGADPAKAQFIEISPSLAVPALVRGTVAAAMVSEPLVTSAGDDVRHLGKPYDTVAKSFYISLFFAKREWLTQNAAIARKLTQSIYDAGRYANTHPDDSVTVLSKYLKLDPDRIRATPRSDYATSIDPKLMQPVLDIATKYGLLEHPVDAGTLIAHVD